MKTSSAKRPAWHWEDDHWNAGAVQGLVEAAVAAGLQKYPEWRCARLADYQGFSHEQRIEGWKRVWVAQRMGLLPRPFVCSVCLRQTQRGHYHCEDYSRPLDAKPICQRCHLALHNRFRSPARWVKLVSPIAAPGCWYADLSMEALPRKGA